MVAGAKLPDLQVADVVGDQLTHQPVERAAHRSRKVQDVAAGGLCLKGTLDGLELALQAADAGKKGGVVGEGMGDRVGRACYFCAAIKGP